MNFSPQQAGALDAVSRWLRSSSRPFFYLAGYAGTGKTTLARHFAEGLDGPVVYGSFTGKAASVMRASGCRDATTIHRLIYGPAHKGTARLKHLQEQLAGAEGPRVDALRAEIQQEVDRLKTPNFRLNPDAEVRNAALIVIDECSMVSQIMGEDLLSFGVPVLVLGDPAQLPPVGGAGYFTSGEPDVMLTEVHRQAAESGILRLATDVREGRALRYCDLGDAQVMARGDLDPADVPSYDQVLVGRNGTRNATNVRMRQLLGRTDPFPEVGDRLVCLRNNHELGLLNGEIYYSAGSADIDDAKLQLYVEPDGGGEVQSVEAWRAPFLGQKLEHWDHSRDVQEFAYGYVLTCHKAQGSQWPRVIVFDESSTFRADAQKWLYTAITRASDYLTVIR